MLFLQNAGVMRVKRASSTFSVGPGDMYFYDGSTEHTLSFDASFDHLAVRVPRRYLESRLPELAEQGSFTVQAGETVIDSVMRPMTTSAMHQTDVRGLVPVVSSVFELFSSKCEEAGIASKNGGTQTKRNLGIKVGHYLDKHLHDPNLNAQSVAFALCVSRRQIDRAVASLGHTFTQWVLEKRLTLAAEILRHPDCSQQSIIDVAFDVGIENHSFFSRKFKQRYNLSPLEYRRQRNAAMRSNTP